MADDVKLYPKHHPWDLEPHYQRHVGAMTSEALHSKADIAIQLAWRDQMIETLRSQAAEREALLARGIELLKQDLAAEHRAWELGYASGYDDRSKMDHDRADVIKTENPYPLPEPQP